MEEFLRTYTDEELTQLYDKTGFPEICRQYCLEKYNEMYDEQLKYDIVEEEYHKGEESLLEYLKEECLWKENSLREHAWAGMLDEIKIDVYIHQREIGLGHEWSKTFCDNLYEKEDICETYTYRKTYQQLRDSRKDLECICDRYGNVLKRKKDTLSDSEFILTVQNMAKGQGEIVERFIGYEISSWRKGKVDDLYQEALSFKKFYEKILEEGFSKEDSWHYALDLWEEDIDSTFSYVYREAMKHNEPHGKAWTFAKFCSRSQINGGWEVDIKEYEDFPEVWKREIIAELQIKDAGKGWHNFEKDIRNSLGLD